MDLHTLRALRANNNNGRVYATQPLEHFEPMVRRIFTRPAFDPRFVGDARMGKEIERSGD
ncbi:MAG TPA: hypothetical protein VJS90_03015 [Pseudomonas sp.]|uniref:hypothetical protein n=1 Tax=Pseudomonas sp. TaxID=306 RepID=UPI002B463A33|nr:hypothetical protein [Pseudomonas sp.]HKS11989.1 hypothetical protein [Pseudomonas sp.]